MSVSKSVAVTYRSLQAIHDLRIVARSASEQTLDRLAAGLGRVASAADLRHLVDADGCRLSMAMADAAHSALLLAATLPDDDFDAFRVATAILLADRLQEGAGEDDLFWHWDAFQSHYRTLPGAERAAVLQGFSQLQADGRIALFDPPEGEWISTETTRSVVSALQIVLAGSGDEFAVRSAHLCLDAIERGDSIEKLSQLWAIGATSVLRLDAPLRGPLIRGVRHVYETRRAWSPHDGTSFDPAAPLPPMIPSLGE